MSQRTVRAN